MNIKQHLSSIADVIVSNFGDEINVLEIAYRKGKEEKSIIKASFNDVCKRDKFDVLKNVDTVFVVFHGDEVNYWVLDINGSLVMRGIILWNRIDEDKPRILWRLIFKKIKNEFVELNCKYLFDSTKSNYINSTFWK